MQLPASMSEAAYLQHIMEVGQKILLQKILLVRVITVHIHQV